MKSASRVLYNEHADIQTRLVYDIQSRLGFGEKSVPARFWERFF